MKFDADWFLSLNSNGEFLNPFLNIVRKLLDKWNLHYDYEAGPGAIYVWPANQKHGDALDNDDLSFEIDLYQENEAITFLLYDASEVSVLEQVSFKTEFETLHDYLRYLESALNICFKHLDQWQQGPIGTSFPRHVIKNAKTELEHLNANPEFATLGFFENRTIKSFKEFNQN